MGAAAAPPPDWNARGRDSTRPWLSAEERVYVMAEIAIKAAQLAQHNRHQTQSSSRQPPDNNGLDEQELRERQLDLE